MPMIGEPTSNLERLRIGTRAAHARMETVPAMARLLAEDLTVGEYVSVLQHLHAFLGHLEPAVAMALQACPAAASMLDGARPQALAADLDWFGAAPIDPPGMPALPGRAAALGALYVIEGSGLGGRVIARHLAQSLGVSPGAGASFYGGLSAEAARLRWQRLQAVLGAAAIGEADATLVEGARATFRTLDDWLRRIGGPAAT